MRGCCWLLECAASTPLCLTLVYWPRCCCCCSVCVSCAGEWAISSSTGSAADLLAALEVERCWAAAGRQQLVWVSGSNVSTGCAVRPRVPLVGQLVAGCGAPVGAGHNSCSVGMHGTNQTAMKLGCLWGVR